MGRWDKLVMMEPKENKERGTLSVGKSGQVRTFISRCMVDQELHIICAVLQKCRLAEVHADMQKYIQTCRSACRHPEVQTCRSADLQKCRCANV